jgi:hypothetical protein
MIKKYDTCIVLRDVYTSSTYHSFLDVILKHSITHKRERLTIELRGCNIDDPNSNRTVKVAKYQYALIADSLRAFLETEQFRRNEMDQYGQNRFTDLRYSPTPEELIELVQRAIAYFDTQAKGVPN